MKWSSITRAGEKTDTLLSTLPFGSDHISVRALTSLTQCKMDTIGQPVTAKDEEQQPMLPYSDVTARPKMTVRDVLAKDVTLMTDD